LVIESSVAQGYNNEKAWQYKKLQGGRSLHDKERRAQRLDYEQILKKFLTK
jgi:hypothetical protein